jgi:hypothetical protein
MKLKSKKLIIIITILVVIGFSVFGIIKYKQKKAEGERLKEIAIKLIILIISMLHLVKMKN